MLSRLYIENKSYFLVLKLNIFYEMMVNGDSNWWYMVIIHGKYKVSYQNKIFLEIKSLEPVALLLLGSLGKSSWGFCC